MGIAHKRDRQALAWFLKKLNFSPVVSIQGPRQSGKSFFARELVSQEITSARYFSLDQKQLRDFAESNPSTFLAQCFVDKNKTVIIDEAQKAPDLFDEIKENVDRQRIPGKFILLGSTEFSIETKIRESLTGRLSRMRLYPFNLSESLKLPLNSNKNPPFVLEKARVTRTELMRYLENGGFPGIFSIKSSLERKQLIIDWLNLICERDIHQFEKLRLDTDVCRNIIEQIALLKESTQANISAALNISSRNIEKYLRALKTLFVIFEVKPFRGSTGKPAYFLTDVGLLHYLGASFEKRLLTWFYIEMLSQISYKGIDIGSLYFYRNTKGKYIHFIFENVKEIVATKLIYKESYDARDFNLIENFINNYSKSKKVKCLALSGGSTHLSNEFCKIYPWESIV